MQKRYWLSYDLGVGGDYDKLYQWLDDHQAVPCGNSMASFNYNYESSQDPDELLKEELGNQIALKPGNILYIVRRKEAEDKDKGKDRLLGSFIYGKRQAAPWTGFGSSSVQNDDE